jgi:hypothetical protein
LEEILELAQRGIDGDSTAHLTYSQGDLEIYPRSDLKQVVPDDLKEIIQEAGDPDGLNNLGFSITQDSPIRRVGINIGPGEWTTYRVESDDQTWAYGRYHELTDKLVSDRTLYAKLRSSRPQTLREGKDDKWRPSAWEPKKDWRLIFLTVLVAIPFALSLIALVYMAFVTAVAYAKPTNTGYTRQQFQRAIQTQKDALTQVHWMGAHWAVIFGLTLSYAIILLALSRWLKSFLKSKVILRKAPFLSQFNFRGSNTDPVALGSFYVALITLIITGIALLIP